MDTLIATHCMKYTVYNLFRLLSSPLLAIKYMPCTHTNKTHNYIVTIITLNKHSKLLEQQEIP